LKNPSECFDELSTNGKCLTISVSPPFALRLSKGERWVFQQPANPPRRSAIAGKLHIDKLGYLMDIAADLSFLSSEPLPA
jgi:predicted ATPase with chaperone activity